MKLKITTRGYGEEKRYFIEMAPLKINDDFPIHLPYDNDNELRD